MDNRMYSTLNLDIVIVNIEGILKLLSCQYLLSQEIMDISILYKKVYEFFEIDKLHTNMLNLYYLYYSYYSSTRAKSEHLKTDFKCSLRPSPFASF